ncbi:hypothetical protein [Cohnella sp.]|uniref:hypothetical protein n=1 Tax=Cohnella sp. TaxID=1883426 RepID=UPI00257A47DE|nr:hypothetical protein [Cohnella sp.]
MIYTGKNRNLKIEPYEPCPCHPENKFKFCCYQKAKTESPKRLVDSNYSDGRVNHMVRKMWEDTDFHSCFGFNSRECSGPIKNAHTIQNNRILNRISVDNHVYRFTPTVNKRGVVPNLEKISKNKASTFFGFCDYHDTEMFKPIERKDYVGEDIQNFLFSFRSIAFEYQKKIRLLRNIKNLFELQPSAMLMHDFVYLYRVAQSDVKDYEHMYERLKQSYLANQFNCFKTIFRQLNYEISFATCATFTVEYDLFGNKINDIYNIGDVKVASIHLNIYPVEGKSNIIITHHINDDDIYSGYFDQLNALDEETLTRYLNYIIIYSTENVFFSPTFIESLSPTQKESLESSFISSINVLKAIELLEKDNYFKFNLFEKRR